MHRSDFGAWGAGLTEGHFGRALAALGVLTGAGLRPANSRKAIETALAAWSQDPSLPLAWRLPSTWSPNGAPRLRFSARWLAEGWEASGIQWRARLEIAEDTPLPVGIDSASAFPWIAEQLSHADVSARSVYVRADAPQAEVTWQWPLRIGFLGDERSQAMMEELTSVREGNSWLQPLVRVLNVAGSARACDVLLLPMDLRVALAAIASLPSTPRADCIVALGRVRGSPAHWYRELVGLRAVARTAGAAVAHVPAGSADGWFTTLMATLSHNEPIDVALFAASRDFGRPAPFLSASRKLVDVSRLATQVRRMARRLGARSMRGRSVDMAAMPTATRVLRMKGARRRLGDVAKRMRKIADEPGGHFLRESDMATASVEIEEAAAGPTAAAGTPAVPTARRFIRAQVYDSTIPGRLVRRKKSLRAAAPHEIVVSIGPPDKDWMTPPSRTRFPEELLPPTEDETHELTVVLTEPHLLEEPAVARITLPRSGNSSACRFYLPPCDTATALDARVIILHQNRVLQTALLRGPFTKGADRGGSKGSLTIEIETVVRLALTDLDQRTSFDAALVLNHTSTGAARVTTVADDRARGIRVSPQMDTVIRWIDDRLSEVANDKKSYEGGLKAKATVDLLRDFARNGRLLYDFIVKNQIGDGGLARGERIQIISALPNARLPAELIYDRRAPEKTAPLCPNAVESLRRGTCGDSCPKGPKENKVVCPLGFWGLSRIIERHGHDPELDEVVGAKDFAFRSERVTGRDMLAIASVGLVAGSQRVDKTVANGMKTICDAISKGSDKTLEPVATWKGWVKKLADAPASLLVLVVHTEVADGAPMPRMEIGTESWLDVVDLDERHMRPDQSRPGPIVLLLGCETGAPEVDFVGFVARCRDYGAAVVVAAGSKIHSLHAVPVARQFVETLRKEVKRDGATFGDVMRVVRREMLASGFPMVLSLTAYGDADWRLTEQTS